MALTDHVEDKNSKCLFSKTRAKEIEAEAKRENKVLVYNQDNPKTRGKINGDIIFINQLRVVKITMHYASKNLYIKICTT